MQPGFIHRELLSLVDKTCTITFVAPMEPISENEYRQQMRHRGYNRVTNACGHCRRRKIRCHVDPTDTQGRCSNCIRLKKKCNFIPSMMEVRRDRKERVTLRKELDKQAREIATESVVNSESHFRTGEDRGRTPVRDRATSPNHYSENERTRSQSPASSFYHGDSPARDMSPIERPAPSIGPASNTEVFLSSQKAFMDAKSSETPSISLPRRPRRALEDESCYQYTPLLDDEIRLLRITPAPFKDPLSCSLKIVPMEILTTTLHEFQALSYAWGTDTPSIPITLSDLPRSGEDSSTTAATQSYTYLVRENLYQALRHIRLTDHYSWIWVDALCLNQDDQAEKGQQIPKMPDIYSNAWNVIAWLGGDDSTPWSPKLAVDLVPDILNLKTLDIDLRRETPGEHILRSWVAFGRILQRPWFKRRWVIQEVACARRLSVRIADHILSWLDFADAVELFSDNIDRMRTLYRESSLYKTAPNALDCIECSQAVALMTFSRNIFRKSTGSSIVSRLMDLETLVLAASHFAVSDTRDIVYALLYLAKDRRRLVTAQVPVPDDHRIFMSDYCKHPVDIFEELVRYSIATSKSLDILCRPWAGWPGAHRRILYQGRCLPSWIAVASWESAHRRLFPASWMEESWEPPSRTRHVPPENLLGPVGGRIYDASRGVAVQTHITSSKQEIASTSSSSSHQFNAELNMMPPRLQHQPGADLVLHARGMILGSITTVSRTPARKGLLEDDWLRTLGWKGTWEQGIDEQLWRTLVANRDPESKFAPTWYRRACALALTKLDEFGNLDTTSLIADPSQPGTLVNYLRRVKEATENRQAFRCENSDGAQLDTIVGLGPGHFHPWAEREMVCILYGSSVPVILREHKDRDGTTVARLIGACYVHGHMEGELFADMSEEEIQKRSTTFSIH